MEGNASLMERLTFGGIPGIRTEEEEGTSSLIPGHRRSGNESESEKTRKNKKAFMGTLFAFNAIALLAIGYLLIAVKGSIFGGSAPLMLGGPDGIEGRWVLLLFLLMATIFMFIHIDYIFQKNNQCNTEAKKLYNQTFAGLFLIIFGIFAFGCSFLYPFNDANAGKINTFIATYFVFVIIGVGLTLDAMNVKKCKETNKELRSFRDVSITGIVFQLLAALMTVAMATMKSQPDGEIRAKFPYVEMKNVSNQPNQPKQPKQPLITAIMPNVRL